MVWVIYPIILKKIIDFRRDINSQINAPKYCQGVSVVIAAHNEAHNIVKRCNNIISQEYEGKIEIIIASDGSKDDTIQLVNKLIDVHPNIILIDIQPQGGRSNAHNRAIKNASHEILVFTDAETVFEDDCIANLVLPFVDEKVGFVSGGLRYFNSKAHAVSESVSLYWKFEMFLRGAESSLGLYATGTGACCAVRKALYREIPSTGDVDFITPLDVVLVGKKCIHTNDAIAWDELPDSPSKELSARVRMTSKNIVGTLSRWGVSSLVRHPLYSISLFHHKIGRWLTPFFLIGLFLSNSLLIISYKNTLLILIFILQVVFYLLGIAGNLKINILYSQQIYSFLLANLGFLLGVLKAIFGRIPHLYKPVSQQKN